MEHLRFHESNSGKDAKASFKGFEGFNVVWLILGCGLAILLFRHLNGKLLWSPLEAGIVSLLPIAIVCAYVFGLKQGKPPSYDMDLLEWIGCRLSGRGFFSPKHVQKITPPPSGDFSHPNN